MLFKENDRFRVKENCPDMHSIYWGKEGIVQEVRGQSPTTAVDHYLATVEGRTIIIYPEEMEPIV